MHLAHTCGVGVYKIVNTWHKGVDRVLCAYRLPLGDVLGHQSGLAHHAAVCLRHGLVSQPSSQFELTLTVGVRENPGGARVLVRLKRPPPSVRGRKVTGSLAQGPLSPGSERGGR